MVLQNNSQKQHSGYPLDINRESWTSAADTSSFYRIKNCYICVLLNKVSSTTFQFLNEASFFVAKMGSSGR